MYIPPHFQWLEARQGPPGDASSGPNSQDSPDPGNKDPGKNGNNNSGGTSARTNAAIIVRFLYLIMMMMMMMKLTVYSVGRCSYRVRYHSWRNPFLHPPHPPSNELLSQIHPWKTPQR